MQTSSSTQMIRRNIARLAAISLFVAALPQAAKASSWNPTLLVNTESFQIIDEGDGSTDIEIRFGDALNERLYWDRTNAQFKLTDDLSVTGYLSGSTLRVDGLAEIQGALSASGAVRFQSTLSGASTITFTNLKSCDTIDTDINGVLSCGTDNSSAGGLGYGDIEGMFVNQGGDTMTGALSVQATLSGYALRVSGPAEIHGTLTASGAVRTDDNLTLNDDQTAADAILTFGSDGTNETLTFSNTADLFEFSDDLSVQGTLSGYALRVSGPAEIHGSLTASGSLSVENGGTIFRDVSYTWPAATATASGQLLSVDPATGQLSWTSGSANSGSIVSLKPQYPNSVYFGSGASAVGTLVADVDTGSTLNFYRWQTTRATNQEYWISTQVRIPTSFRSWDPVAPIQFGYRGSGGTLSLKLFDTNDALVSLTGGTNLTTNSTSWSTATVTGPESAGTYAADDYITLMVKMVSSGSTLLDEFADAGLLEFNWETKD